jgi:hypothetical protein
VPLPRFEHRIVTPEAVSIPTELSRLHIQTLCLQQAANERVTVNCHSAATGTAQLFPHLNNHNCQAVNHTGVQTGEEGKLHAYICLDVREPRIFGTQTLRDHLFQYNCVCVDLSSMVMAANEALRPATTQSVSVKPCRRWLQALWDVIFLQSLQVFCSPTAHARERVRV